MSFSIWRNGRGIIGEKGRSNPFVEIGQTYRFAVLVYFIWCRFIPSLIAPFYSPAPYYTDAWVLAALLVLSNVLLLAPFFIKTIGGLPTGWLHPLIITVVLSVGISVLKDPLQLVSPILMMMGQLPAFDEHLYVPVEYAVLLELNLQRELLFLVALLAYLFGFLVFVSGVEVRHRNKIRIRVPIVLLLFAMCTTAFVLTMQRSGGLLSHFESLSEGRFPMREQIGHFLVVIKLAPYLLVGWYAADQRQERRPLFWLLVAGAFFMTFVSTGSRGGLFIVALLLLIVRVWHTRKVPIFGLFVLLVGAYVAVGTLGALRQGRLGDTPVLSAASEKAWSIEAWLDRTAEEMRKKRKIAGDYAVLHELSKGAERLNGRSYLGALLFFVPRTLWPDKPRGGGAHVGALLAFGDPSTVGYQGMAFPISGPVEAYWNFSWGGVVLLGLLFGLLQSGLARRFAAEPRNHFGLLLLLLATIEMRGFSSEDLVVFSQVFSMMLVFWSLACKTPSRTLGVRQWRAARD